MSSFYIKDTIDTPRGSNLAKKRSIYSLLHNAKLAGKTRDINWLNKHIIQKNNLAITGSDPDNIRLIQLYPDDKQTVYTQLDSMIKLFNRVYDTKWDIQILPHFTSSKFCYFSIHFLIHYDKVTISNTDELNHNLEDLIVMLHLNLTRDSNNNVVLGFNSLVGGTRYTLDFDEWYHGYIHSHLNSSSKRSLDDFSQVLHFCMGATDLYQLLNETHLSFDIDKLDMILSLLDSYVSYESLDGGPYIKIEDISNVSYVTDDLRYMPTVGKYSFESSWVNTSFSKDILSIIQYNIQDNKFVIRDLDELGDILKQYIIEKDISNLKEMFLCVKKENEYYSIASVINSLPYVLSMQKKMSSKNTNYVYIQNKKLSAKIINPKFDTLKDIIESLHEKSIIHPINLRNYADAAEDFINAKALTAAYQYKKNSSLIR